MRRDFEITEGIYLSQSPHYLDLHNAFNFCGLNYSIENRTLSLHWRRTSGGWVAGSVPASLCIAFQQVSEFRFFPRKAEMPFTEDDCVSTFGYWTDEAWAEGVFFIEPNQPPEPSWLTAISFMSGAVIAVKAESAYARIEV